MRPDETETVVHQGNVVHYVAHACTPMRVVVIAADETVSLGHLGVARPVVGLFLHDVTRDETGRVPGTWHACSQASWTCVRPETETG